MDLDQSVAHAHGHYAKPKPAAQLHILPEGPPGHPSRAPWHADIHGIGDGKPSDPLMDQGEGEAGLQLHDDWWIVTAARDNVSVDHFSLHAEALPLKKGLHWAVEVGFAGSAHRPAGRV